MNNYKILKYIDKLKNCTIHTKKKLYYNKLNIYTGGVIPDIFLQEDKILDQGFKHGDGDENNYFSPPQENGVNLIDEDISGYAGFPIKKLNIPDYKEYLMDIRKPVKIYKKDGKCLHCNLYKIFPKEIPVDAYKSKFAIGKFYNSINIILEDHLSSLDNFIKTLHSSITTVDVLSKEIFGSPIPDRLYIHSSLGKDQYHEHYHGWIVYDITEYKKILTIFNDTSYFGNDEIPDGKKKTPKSLYIDDVRYLKKNVNLISLYDFKNCEILVRDIFTHIFNSINKLDYKFMESNHKLGVIAKQISDIFKQFGVLTVEEIKFLNENVEKIFSKMYLNIIIYYDKIDLGSIVYSLPLQNIKDIIIFAKYRKI